MSNKPWNENDGSAVLESLPEVKHPDSEQTQRPGLNGAYAKWSQSSSTPATRAPSNETQAPLALFCFECSDGPLGMQVAKTACALADEQVPVHLFTRQPCALSHPRVFVHAVGDCGNGSIHEQVDEYTRRAVTAFQIELQGKVAGGILGYEWSTVQASIQAKGGSSVPVIIDLHSLERQRSALDSPDSKRINEIEVEGLRQAQTILFHDAKTAEHARTMLPDCAGRLVPARWTFPAHEFESELDPGAIKARYQVGPVDPTILYVGDFDERHGGDALMKAVPAILKNHKQARFIFVGDGALFWPMKVHARYLLLEYAVRQLGDVSGKDVRDLIQAADIIVVPSREQTEWWPVLAGWAARRPVVTTHEMSKSMELHHEQDSVLVYANPGSIVWGVERLLFDADLRQRMVAEGRKQLDERFGWKAVARQIHELVMVARS